LESKKESSLPQWVIDEVEIIKDKARKMVNSPSKKLLAKINYLVAAGLAFEIPFLLMYFSYLYFFK